MRHITTAALATLLALVAYTQREQTIALRRITAEVTGHEADLRNLQALSRGEKPKVNNHPLHVGPDTPTPITEQDCAKQHNCTHEVPQIREF